MSHALNKVYLTRAQVRQRYNCADRTIARWVADADLAFPQAIIINGRWFFDLADIETWERARATSNSNKKAA